MLGMIKARRDQSASTLAIAKQVESYIRMGEKLCTVVPAPFNTPCVTLQDFLERVAVNVTANITTIHAGYARQFDALAVNPVQDVRTWIANMVFFSLSSF